MTLGENTMYTIEWVSDFQGFSKDEKMDLHKFVLFYDQYIAEKLYIYTTTSPMLPSFIVEARQSQLPHLMGLQYWNNLPVKQASKQYESMLDGDWDMNYLEAADRGSYLDHRSRIEFLPHLYNLLYRYDCQIKLISHTVPSPFKNRKIDMIFQKDGSKLTYALELREKVKKGDKTGIFVLTSVSIHNKNKPLRGKFLKLNITNVEIKDA